MLPAFMRAMTLGDSAGELLCVHKPVPQARGHRVLVRVLACGVCRTDLHIVHGELPQHRHGIVPGHEVVDLKSVANLTRHDGEAFFRLAAELPLQTRVQTFGLADASLAMDAVRNGALNGAAVLVP
jgi:D-arabinose 1-dehydrogenase-like Zn-dependent alcohol dehydrogenase